MMRGLIQSILIGSITLFACSCSKNGGVAPKPEVPLYRIVNITFPMDSPHRSIREKPPTLAIKIQENGREIGKRSTSHMGWETDFPDVEQNRWSIAVESDSRYSIGVWDTKNVNEIVFRITGLSGKDFKKEIMEKGGEMDTSDRLAKLLFEKVEKTSSPSD